MSKEYKILIAEDDEQLARKLSQFLSSWSYKVRRIENFELLLDEFKDFDPDLVLMDVYLPYLNGHAWTHQIRQISNVPVIFLSSADDTSNMLTAFGQGADDYICKPFELSVLAAKIKAMLHRAYDFGVPPSILEKGEISYDVQSYIVTHKEQSLTLSKNEGRILKMLLENDTKIVSRNALMDDLWNTDCYVDENTLSVNINRLRKKLESIGIKDLIKTHKGQGYSL